MENDSSVFSAIVDISGWAADSMGIHAAGWGLTLTPMDMAKKKLVVSITALFVPKAGDRIELIEKYIAPA